MDPDPASGDAQNIAAAVETLTLAATSTADAFSSPIPFPSSPAVAAAAAAAASPVSPNALPADSAVLHDLASRGQWRALLDSTSRSLPLPHPPQTHLVHLTLHTLALFKLRRFSDATAALPPFSDPRFHPPSSILPFALRLLHALLPQHLSDRPLSLDRLYSLLSFTRSRLPAPEWRRREAFLLSTLFCNHFAHREFDVALSLVHSLLAAAPSDPVLLSRLAYIQLQIGDLHAATATFSTVSQLCPDHDIQSQNLVQRNRALVLLVAKDYVGAAREYEECIERDPADVVAVNNKALCLLYSRDLSDSIKLLEGALERVPTAAVNETLVVNLCSMYELAYVNHGEIKKSLSNWIARVAPDDFDPSCTRI